MLHKLVSPEEHAELYTPTYCAGEPCRKLVHPRTKAERGPVDPAMGMSALQHSERSSSTYDSAVAFHRRRAKGEPFRTFAMTSGGTPGPFDEWPNVEPDAAAAHEQHYNQQRDRLNGILVEQGQADEIFVAKVFAVTRPDGGSHTYTTWTEGVSTLLPGADVILLVEQPVDAGSDPVMTWVRWDVVASVCADQCWTVMTDFQPPRIRTRQWPSPGQLADLKTRSLT